MSIKILSGVIIALALLVAGIFIGTMLPRKTTALKGDQVNTFQAGWEAAKKRLAESGFVPVNLSGKINQISGSVKEVKGSTIVLRIRPLEPLADPALDERIIEIESNSKIYLVESRDAKEMEKAMEIYNKEILAQASNPATDDNADTQTASPDPYTKKPATVADIKTGAQIEVVAHEEDVKNAKQFKVIQVNIY